MQRRWRHHWHARISLTEACQEKIHKFGIQMPVATLLAIRKHTSRDRLEAQGSYSQEL
ncbi:uncharacterized protein TrAtP1_005154 [Trichoderma atroviride]|uniref:uncharacterized protein n=1 Tax=Hypocrea atroviridis TaxID=63577 RepID=UPI003320655E|nr:hypothetical protein TrAtP1_005154 [Trichoderma atroviride]